jgi:tetratricopeptide (TPR) repeat protein
MTSRVETIFLHSELQTHLDELLQSQPNNALTVAREALLRNGNDLVLQVVAWTVIGRALNELGDMRRGPQAMRRALLVAERLGDDQQLLRTRMSAALVFAEAGEADFALRLLHLAEKNATGTMRGRVRTQKAFVLHHLGEDHLALAEIDRAGLDFHRGKDPLATLRRLVNRSIILLRIGRLSSAESDLRKAAHLADRLGQTVISAGIVGNLAVIQARQGRLGDALVSFDQALLLYQGCGNPLRSLLILKLDRVETLERSGLFEAATLCAQEALGFANASGSIVAKGDAELALARAHLAMLEFDQAVLVGRCAASTLRKAGRFRFSLQARSVVLQGLLRRSSLEDIVKVSVRARRLCERLVEYGWLDEARILDSARWHGGWRHAVLQELTNEKDFESSLQDVVRGSKSHSESRRSSISELRGVYVCSLRMLEVGDPSRAVRGIDRYGKSVVDRGIERGASGRSHAGIVRDMACLGVRVGLELSAPLTVLRWADHKVDGLVWSALANRSSIRQILGRQVLARYVVDEGELWAVVGCGKRLEVVRIGPLRPIVRIVRLFAAKVNQGRVKRSDVAILQTMAEELCERIVQPLKIPGRLSCVFVVPNELCGMPWGALPSLANRTHALFYRLSDWLSTVGREEAFGNASASIVGPNVVGGSREFRAMKLAYPKVVSISGRSATKGSLERALHRFEVVHVAAHGDIATRQPGLSALRLCDGVLSAVETSEFDIRARVVVLTSCSMGGGVSQGGVSGMSNAIMLGGAGAVVAPISPVQGHSCAYFTELFHSRLACADSVGEAMAFARKELVLGSSDDWAAAASFVCTGRPDLRLETSSDLS